MSGAHYVKLAFGAAIAVASSYLSGVKAGTRYCAEVVSATWLTQQRLALGKFLGFGPGTRGDDKFASIALAVISETEGRGRPTR